MPYDSHRIDDRAARLELNGRPFRYDANLERAADLFDADPQAWLRLPPRLQDLSGIYREFRDNYRRAVAAGVIPDDQRPPATDGPSAA